MRRFLPAMLMATVGFALLMVAGRADAQDKNWATIKGQIVWGGKNAPPETWLEVTADKGHCHRQPSAHVP